MVEVSRRAVVGGLAGSAAVTALSTGLQGVPAALAGSAESTALRPVRLTTEHLTDPLGIDATRPRFGWRLEASGEDRTQTAYRILVASKRELLRDGHADVWDSGRVSSAEQTAQLYAGRPLRAKTRYFWTVRAWDESGRPGPYADPAWFETAMLSEQDWTARWIGSGRTIPHAVRVLDPRQTEDVPLTPGNTLGQSFVTHGPTVAVTVLLKLGSDTAAGFVMTLHRDGPSGAVVGSRTLSGLAGDRYLNVRGRLDFAEPLDAGTYYLELSEPEGDVRWPSAPYDDPRADPYPEGTGFTNGQAEQVDRWVYTSTPPAPANPLLRKEFSLGSSVVSARLYLCGLGHGLAWINGEPVNPAELTPAATDYDRRLLYTTYDVTPLLRRGTNAVGIALGRGFFATREPDTDGSNLQRWVSEPQGLAQLEVALADGRTVTIGTDASWLHTEGPTTYEGVFNGETYDARRAAALDGWATAGYDASDWTPVKEAESPGGRLEAFAGPPIRPTATVRPASVRELPDGTRLIDFGAVLTGNVRLSGRLAAGTKVSLQYAEKLGDSGRIEVGLPAGNENPSIDGRYQRDEYIAGGRGEETWQAAFTYKGFQYVEVSGAPHDLEVVAVQVNTDVAETMELKLDSPVLQWIADAFKRTARNGLHGHPDVAGIGKAGWTGANHWMAQPALYQFGMQSVYAKWLDDLRLGQAPDGELPLVAPMGATSNGFLFTPSSIGAYPYLVLRYSVTYGDKALAARHFESVRKYIEWSVRKLAEGVSADQFGDWYPPNPPRGYPAGPEGGELVGVAYVIQSLRQGTALAELLGETAQASAWRAKTKELVEGFNARFLDTAAGVYHTERTDAGYRQTSNAVPLAFGFVPDEHRARVLANLAADIEARDRHLDTGNVGTATLPFALTDHGRSDLAHAVLSQTDYPSYGYLRSLGATTFWESWEAGSRGHNDPTLSGPVSWLVERVVGVQATSPGWARFRVAPSAFGSLGWASVSLDTVRGQVAAGWRRDGDVVALHVRVPVNAVADVTLPNGKHRELGSGRHLIVTRLP